MEKMTIEIARKIIDRSFSPLGARIDTDEEYYSAKGFIEGYESRQVEVDRAVELFAEIAFTYVDDMGFTDDKDAKKWVLSQLEEISWTR